MIMNLHMCWELKGRTQLSVRGGRSSSGGQDLCSIGSHTGTSVQVSHRDSKGCQCEEGDEKSKRRAEEGTIKSKYIKIMFGQSSLACSSHGKRQKGIYLTVRAKIIC